MYRVVQWATGSMGRTALRRIIDHPDLELAGLYVYSDVKAGLDAGEIAKRPPTGITATNDVEQILALDADIVLHTARISLPYEEQNEDVIRLLTSGKNVISIAGFHYPAAHGEDYAGPLRAACEAGQSTLAGLGLNPGFVAERAALVMTGLCAKVDTIRMKEIVDASLMTAPEFVFDLMGFGADPELRDLATSPNAELFGTLYRESFAYVAAAMGTEIETLTPDHRMTLAPHDLEIAAGTIPKGTVAATEWCWRGRFADKSAMTLSILWTAAPEHLAGADKDAHWTIEIEGRPNVTLTFGIHDPDPAAPHSRPAADATVATAIRAIPDVCAAEPGFFAYPPLAPFNARLGD